MTADPGLRSRLLQLADRAGGVGPLAVKAKLSRGAISTMLTHMKKKPGAGMRVETAQKIVAVFPDVSLDWLLRGMGEGPDRYPNRFEALTIMRGRVSREALDEIRSVAMHSDSDLSVGQWVDRIREADARIHKGTPLGTPLPDEDDTPPAGRKR